MASITQTGPNSFRVQVRNKGFEPITRTFNTRAKAEKFKDRMEALIDAGLQPDAPEKGGVTVAQAIKAFRELRQNAGREVSLSSNEHYMLNHLEAGMGRWVLANLTPKKLASWASTRMEEGAGPATIGMEVSKLGTVVRHASTWLRTPLPDVVAPARPMLEYSGLIGPSKSRDRRPTAEELAGLFGVADPLMGDIMAVAILTTMRRGEICRIRWPDLDRGRRLVMIRDRKHPRRKIGNHVWQPLPAGALAIIESQPQSDERIFPVAPEWISDTFHDMCQALAIADLIFHDLRHEGTSRLFESGWDIPQAALVTGHLDWKSLRRYANLRPAHASTLPAPALDRGIPPRPGDPQSASPGPRTWGSESDPR